MTNLVVVSNDWKVSTQDIHKTTCHYRNQGKYKVIREN